MEESKEQLVPFDTIVKALGKFCSEQRTGSLYIFTAEEHGAVVSVVQGRIVDVFYRTVRGVRALPLMRRIKQAKFFFKKNPDIAGPEASTNKIELPANDEIFSIFSLKVSNVRTGQVQGGTDNNAVHSKVKLILVVEDSNMARKSIVQMLSAQGYETIEAVDGFDALGKLGQNKVDLVMLDLILPKMDGYAVLNAMKKEKEYKHIPVIVLTSRDALFDKLKGKMSGTDEYLTKPVKPDELLSKLQKYLHRE